MCCFSLAHGLKLSKSILKVSLEANPIGNSGMSVLMKAKTENNITDFELNLKLCDSEVEQAAESSAQPIFDITNPEGNYTLKIGKQYD